MHISPNKDDRRLLSFHTAKVEDALPEFFASSYPKFISLLKEYYEFEKENSETELLYHMYQTRDISETDITLLNFIEDELLLGSAYSESFNDVRSSAKFSSTLFRAKGSKYSIQWFFRTFFNLPVDVIYPKNDIFKIGESEIGPDSVRFLTNDELYQTFALLIRTEIPISEWKEIFKLFVHPAGMYLGGQVLLIKLASLKLENEVLNIVQATNPSYSFSNSTVQEGDVATATISGSNIPDTNLFYYVVHDTTDDDDFVTPPPTDPNNLSAVPVVSNSGSVTFTMNLDAETETTEQFFVRFYDGPDVNSSRFLGISTINVTDVLPTYTVTRSAASITEGDGATFTITQNFSVGYEDFNYTITGADAARNVSPASGTVSAAQFISNSGTFSIPITSTLSTAQENQETITFNGSGSITGETPSGDTTISIDDAAAIHAISVKEDSSGNIVSSFDEGQTVRVEYTSSNSDAASVFIEIVAGTVNSADFTNPSSGTTAVVGTPQQITTAGNPDTFVYTIDINTDGDADETFTVAVYDDVNRTTTLATSGTITINAAGQPTLVSKLGSNQQTTFKEGNTITFEAGGTGLTNGSYWFGITHTTTDNADFTSVPPQDGTREELTVSGNVFTTQPTALTLANNPVFEGNQTFVAALYDAQSGGSIVGATNFTVTVEDADATYAIAFSPTDIDEGEVETATLTVTTTNVADGTTIGYVLSGTGIDTSDIKISDQASTGFATPASLDVANGDADAIEINSNVGTLYIRAVADNAESAAETLNLELKATDSAGNTTSSPDADLTINNTSAGSSTSDGYVMFLPGYAQSQSFTTAASISLTLNSDGTYAQSGSPYVASDNNPRDGFHGNWEDRWCTGNYGSQYQVYISAAVTGSAVLFAGTLNTWQGLDSNRTWTYVLGNGEGDAEVSNVQFTIEFKTWDGTTGGLGSGTTVCEKIYQQSLGVNQTGS